MFEKNAVICPTDLVGQPGTVGQRAVSREPKAKAADITPAG